jgi:hypothetical protein
MSFCEHLDAYGAQYTKTEAAYHQCNHLVRKIQDEGGNDGLVGLLEQALTEWKSDNEKLRAEFCSLVGGGEIILPAKVRKHPRCSECGFEVPKLEYKEWSIACNGVAELNGEELMVPLGV